MVTRPEGLDALRAAVEQKDLLLATLGHEMRNPLGAMRMAVRLIRESEERTVRDHARVCWSAKSTCSNGWSPDVLGGLQAQQGTMQLHLAPMDITEVVRGAVESVRHVITQKNQQLHVGVPIRPWCR